MVREWCAMPDPSCALRASLNTSLRSVQAEWLANRRRSDQPEAVHLRSFGDYGGQPSLREGWWSMEAVF